MSLNIDIVIFVLFLIANLAVGLSYGRKVKTIRDYALGDRNFSTTALVATIVATWSTGSVFFVSLSEIYSDGLYFFVPSFCAVFQMLFIAYLLVPRMGEFLG